MAEPQRSSCSIHTASWRPDVTLSPRAVRRTGRASPTPDPERLEESESRKAAPALLGGRAWLRGFEWAVQDSNLRPPACKAGALPAELTARAARMVALAAGILARPPPSTSGPGRHPFKVVARVRIPLGAFSERRPMGRCCRRIGWFASSIARGDVGPAGLTVCSRLSAICVAQAMRGRRLEACGR